MSKPLPKLPLITYNLKERGRQYRGTQRNFNIKAICDAINSPSCQERVKTRAMLGYYGHKPRVLFGLEPVEAGVIGGKYNEIEPAIVTTRLEASYDGTITHQTEFLDTAAGRKAAAMYENRIGGFSSAIDEKRPEFYGFVWVLDPNYSTNRPFTLDSVNDDGSELTLDQVMEQIKEEQTSFLDALIESKNRQIELLQAALDNATLENEQYLSLLSAKGIDGNGAEIATHEKPLVVSLDSTNQLLNDINAFRQEAVLPVFVEKRKPKTADKSYERLMSQLGYR